MSPVRTALVLWLLIAALTVPSTLAQQATEAPGEWTFGAQMHYTRCEFGAAELDGRIYVAGGLLDFWEGRDTAEVYDIASDTWQDIASLPFDVHHPGMTALNGKIYLSGGWTGSGEYNMAVYAYDPDADEWAFLTDLPEFRAAHLMVTLDDRLYFVGGVTGVPEVETDAVWSYDPATNTWKTDHAPMPTARESLAGDVIEGRLYVTGGRRAFARTLIAHEVYDPAADEWTTITASTLERAGHTASAVNGTLHVLGGETWEDSPRALPNHEVYHPAEDTWSTAPDLPRWGLHGLVSVGYDGRLYIIGGCIQGGTQQGAVRQLSIYTPAG